MTAESTTVTTVAVIGVGKMGGGIARNLARDPRFRVRVFDLSAEAVAACAEAGADGAASAEAAAAGADVVITSLPMPAHVSAMWAALAPGLAPGAICVDVSTIDPTTARQVADDLGATGRPFVACLLGKGPAQAEAGEIPLFVGGEEAALDALGELFSVIGDTVHRLGTVEAACAFKLASNLIGMTNLAVLAEGYRLCLRAGVAPEAFAAALANTGGSSFQSQVRLPWIMADDYAPRFPIVLGLKDVRLAVDIASQWGIPVPVGAAGMVQLANAVAHGLGQEDVNALAKLSEPVGYAH